MTLDIALGTFAVTAAVVVRRETISPPAIGAYQLCEPGFANNNEDTGYQPVD